MRRERRGRGSLLSRPPLPHCLRGGRYRRVPVASLTGDTASPTPGLDEGTLAEIAVDGTPCFLAEAGVALGHFVRRQRAERDRPGDQRGGSVLPDARRSVRHGRARPDALDRDQQHAVAGDPRRGDVTDLVGSPAFFGVHRPPRAAGVALEAERAVVPSLDETRGRPGRHRRTGWWRPARGHDPDGRRKERTSDGSIRGTTRSLIGPRSIPMSRRVLPSAGTSSRLSSSSRGRSFVSTAGRGRSGSASGRRPPVRRRRHRRPVLGIREQHDLPAGRRERRGGRPARSGRLRTHARRGNLWTVDFLTTPSSGSTKTWTYRASHPTWSDDLVFCRCSRPVRQIVSTRHECRRRPRAPHPSRRAGGGAAVEDVRIDLLRGDRAGDPAERGGPSSRGTESTRDVRHATSCPGSRS